MYYPELNIAGSLREHAVVTPHKTVFIVLDDDMNIGAQLTYGQLEEKVLHLVAQPQMQALKGERILLVYQEISEFIIAFLACQYAGIIPVPVPFVRGSKQLDRLKKISADADVSAVFTTHASITLLGESLHSLFIFRPVNIVITDQLPVSGSVKERPSEGRQEISFIQYTSGSTGNPKGVVISHENLISNQKMIAHAFGCERSSVIFSWLPFHHDMGLIGNILHTIYVGCTAVLMSPFHFIQHPRHWLEAIGRYRVTHSGGPDYAYALCVKKVTAEQVELLDLSSWKVAYNGSELVRHNTLQLFSGHFSKAGFQKSAFYPCYGLAEATLLVAGTRATQEQRVLFIDQEEAAKGRIIPATGTTAKIKSVVSCGSVSEGISLKIISVVDGHLCEEMEEGIVCIAGTNVTTGYWNKPDETLLRKIGTEDFFETGDLGFLYNNELFIHGRFKEMLLIRGRNFYPQDIEEIVMECDTAIEANGTSVFSIPGTEEAFVVVAELKRTGIQHADTSKIIRTIERDIVAAFGIEPHDILLTGPLSIPRTTSGKIQRVKCRDMYFDRGFRVIASKNTLPVQPAENGRRALLLAQVRSSGSREAIKSYLQLVIETRVNILPGDFSERGLTLTDIGLDSIRATELINIFNRDLSINLDVSQTLQNNTVEGLVSTIENILWLRNSEQSGKEIMI